MGNYKKRHAQDKLYITQKQMAEWGYGGHQRTRQQDFKRLPFDCCSLSLRPATKPMITKQGHVFDFINIIPWLKKFSSNPITGEKLEAKDLISVTFHKNTNDKYHCPVLYGLFNEQTHIVCIWKSGHVYSMRAIQELCIKNKNLKDLITEKPFTKDDIIDIQNPLHLEKFNFTQFHYLKKGVDVKSVVKNQATDLLTDLNGSRVATSSLNRASQEVSDTLKEFYENRKEDPVLLSINDRFHDKQLKPAESGDAKSHFTTGRVGMSFTSTATTRHTVNETAIRDDREMRNKFIKQKGYVQILTSCGALNFELHCDLIPLACENFIELSKRKYYNGTIFHRLIPDFMVQGGDPTGTGKGGESIFENKGHFKDEFRQSLRHNKRGTLSMANQGPHTNLSQFFITLTDKHLDHLDRNHTIFGRLVGGEEVLNKIEFHKTDADNRPVEKIYIEKIDIFVNPFDNANRKIERIKLGEQLEREQKEEEEKEAFEKREKRMAAIERAKGREMTLEELLAVEKEEAILNKPKGVGRYLTQSQKTGDESLGSGQKIEERVSKRSPKSSSASLKVSPAVGLTKNLNWDLDNIDYEDFNADKLSHLEKLKIEELKERAKDKLAKKVENDQKSNTVGKKKVGVVIARPAETVKKLMRQQIANKAAGKSKSGGFGNFSSW